MLARTYVHTAEFRDIMIRSHGEILAVIAAGDDERAGEVAVEHIRTSYLRVVARYDDKWSDSATAGLSTS